LDQLCAVVSTTEREDGEGTDLSKSRGPAHGIRKKALAQGRRSEVAIATRLAENFIPDVVLLCTVLATRTVVAVAKE